MIQKNQISQNWEIIKKDISEINLENIRVLPVTKTVGIEEIQQLIEIGFTRFAENRIELAIPKFEHFKDSKIEWDFIGNIQSRKIPDIVKYFKLIHSVSNLKTAKKISKAAEAMNKKQEILLQVNIAQENQKSGFSVDEIKSLFQELNELKNIQINGLMAMAPLTSDEKIIKQTFADLKKLLDKLKPIAGENFKELSMGMTNDYVIAVEEGSTILRIGSAFFKERE